MQFSQSSDGAGQYGGWNVDDVPDNNAVLEIMRDRAAEYDLLILDLTHPEVLSYLGYAEGRPVELYDLEKDPGETTNLYNKHPEIVKQLKEKLEAFKAGGRSAPERKP
mgnify:CR=1 FL=1